MCRYAYPQDILIQFFSRNLTKMKDTTETVGQHNSTEPAQQNSVGYVSLLTLSFIELCRLD